MLYQKDEVLAALINKGILLGTAESGYRVNPYLEMPKSLSFSDVAIGQGKSKCASRLGASVTSEVARGLELNVPLIASNMSAVIIAAICIKLFKVVAQGLLHLAWRPEQ